MTPITAIRRLCLACFLLTFAFAPLARPALAHGALVRSDPPDLCGPLALPRPAPNDPRCATGALLESPPAAVQLWFSEAVAPFGGGIRVLGPSGQRVEHGPARADGGRLSVEVDAREQGTYLVRWQVIARDTHPARGAFAFSVGRADANPPALALEGGEAGGITGIGLALQVAGRWLHFIGYALGFGPLAFGLLVLRPLPLSDRRAAERPLARLAGIGVALLLLAELLALLAQTASLAPSQTLAPDAIADVLASSAGRVLALRLGGALLLWMLLGGVQHGSVTASRVAMLLAVGLAVVDGQASHALTGEAPALGLMFNTVHIVAMGLWVGGLAALLALWPQPALRDVRSEIARRFGRPATLGVAALLMTGVGMALLHLPRLNDLSDTSYGRAMTVKLLVVLGALGLAWIGLRARQRRARWWRLEELALLAVVALAGLVVSFPPPN